MQYREAAVYPMDMKSYCLKLLLDKPQCKKKKKAKQI